MPDLPSRSRPAAVSNNSSIDGGNRNVAGRITGTPWSSTCTIGSVAGWAAVELDALDARDVLDALDLLDPPHAASATASPAATAAVTARRALPEPGRSRAIASQCRFGD